MSDHEFVKAMAIQNRQRMVATVMNCIEKEIAPRLPANERSQLISRFRTRVMQAVGAYHDVTLDMLKASIADGSMTNEVALSLLQQIHVDQQKLLDKVS